MSSERWAGFSDEDIERIKSNPNVTKSCSEICELDGYTSTSKCRRPMKIKKISPKSEIKECPDDLYVGSMCNVKPKESSPAYEKIPTLEDSDENSRLTENEENCTCNNYGLEENQLGQPVTLQHTSENTSDLCDESSEGMEQSSTNLLPLEIFEMRQKRIEAENARRRALISKAINDKKMRTQAEAIKLAKITQELNRIDSSLSADVSILRNYIEKASLEFSEAEKRYLKAEKEFVEAKLVLFEKMQRKEMLTEHLCAIIEQNENRKADKLVELMKQLEMEVIVEDCEINGIQPILPNLCALNDEPYQSCQTIKPTVFQNNSQFSVNEMDQKSECGEKKEDIEVSDENILNDINANINPSTERYEQV